MVIIFFFLDDFFFLFFINDEEEFIVEFESFFLDIKFIIFLDKWGIVVGFDRWKMEKFEMVRLEFG